PADLDAAVAAAAAARVGDDRAAAVARPAGLLDGDEPLVEDHRPLAVAPSADGRLGSRPGPRPAALPTDFLAGKRLRLLDPGPGLDQIDVENGLDVATGPRTAPLPSTTALTAEEAAEQVVEQVVEGAAGVTAGAHPGQPVVPVLVVPVPLLRVLEHLVGL